MQHDDEGLSKEEMDAMFERIMRSLPETTPEYRRRCKLILDARIRRKGDERAADALWLDERHPTRPGFIRSDAFSWEEIELARAPGSNGYVWHVDADGIGWIKRLYARP